MSENEINELESEIIRLEDSKEGLSWMEKLDIQDKIHNIKMKINGVKPEDSHIDCIGCGS